MKITISNAELLKLLRSDIFFYNLLDNFVRNHEKTEFVFIQRCLEPPLIQPIKFAF